MGTLTVKSKSLNTQAEYEGEGLKINVKISEDAIEGGLKSLNGNIYHSDDSTYAGNFDGNQQNGEIEYSMSSVKSKDMPAVIAALTELEQIISGQQQ